MPAITSKPPLNVWCSLWEKPTFRWTMDGTEYHSEELVDARRDAAKAGNQGIRLKPLDQQPHGRSLK